MSDSRIVNTTLGAVCVAVLSSVAIGDVLWRARLLSGGMPGFPAPAPYYRPLAVPGTAGTPGSADALGADFSQVYMSARALIYGQSEYDLSGSVPIPAT